VDPTGLQSSVQWCYQSPANAETCNEAGMLPKPIRMPPPISVKRPPPTERECKKIYKEYKDSCSTKDCDHLQCDCSEAMCGEIKYRMNQARKCYSLRDLYLRRGCDEIIPTKANHPATRDNALKKYMNCQDKYAECCFQ